MGNASISFEKAVAIALEQHLAGNFARAEALYLEILRQDPTNVDAIHLLGVLAYQGHKPEIAVDLISTAIRRKDDAPIFHYNLAEALHALDRKDEALASYRKAVELDPNYYEALNNLANLLNDQDQPDAALIACQRAIAIDPDGPAAYNNMGNSLRLLDRSAEAIEPYRTAIRLRPKFPEAINNLGLCLCSLSRFEEGIEQFLAALQHDPSNAELHNNLGVSYTRINEYEKAAASFQTAIDLDENYADAYCNLGSALQTLHKIDLALPLYEKATRIRPDFLDAHSNLGNALSMLGRKEEALESIDAALKIKPRAKEHFMRAATLREMGRADEGIVSLQKCLEMEPDNVGALTALGFMYQERGEIEPALEAMNRAMHLKPDSQTHSSLLMTMNYHPAYSSADLFNAHRQWGEMHEDPLKRNWKKHANVPSPDRRLRIGYVSPDLRSHSVSFFVEPILQNHDHSKVEVFAYAHLINADMETWRLRAQIDQWRETSGVLLDKIAQQIFDDQIDILVDLSGHTAHNCMSVFALKPAPIQINMIGFPSTTGLSGMDYRITDERCDPIGVSDPYNSETLIRMPDIFWCYQPPDFAPPVGELPALDDVVTFTAVNNFAKCHPEVQNIWARILAAVPNSRLIIQTIAVSSEHVRKSVRNLFAAHGVSEDRVEFRKPTGVVPYLELLERSDMTLDPFPFNGGTTTCHSLWMGAPVLTLAGDRHASRMGLSMMTAIGLPEFVAYTPEQYVEIAKTFAADLPRLAKIRATMRERLLASPLLDAATYTRNLESVYRRVWQEWCSKHPA